MDKATPSLSFTWVDETDHLTSVINHLHQQKVIAVDTESDSLYSYFEKVCLNGKMLFLCLPLTDEHLLLHILTYSACLRTSLDLRESSGF